MTALGAKAAIVARNALAATGLCRTPVEHSLWKAIGDFQPQLSYRTTVDPVLAALPADAQQVRNLMRIASADRLIRP